MRISDNMSIVDVSYNLSGSLTGIPAVLDQLPVGELIGFDDLPKLTEDIPSFGQTWTPDLKGVDIRGGLPIYNELAVKKAPFTSNLYGIDEAWKPLSVLAPVAFGAVPITSLAEDTVISGKTLYFLNTDAEKLSTFFLEVYDDDDNRWRMLNMSRVLIGVWRCTFEIKLTHNASFYMFNFADEKSAKFNVLKLRIPKQLDRNIYFDSFTSQPKTQGRFTLHDVYIGEEL